MITYSISHLILQPLEERHRNKCTTNYLQLISEKWRDHQHQHLHITAIWLYERNNTGPLELWDVPLYSLLERWNLMPVSRIRFFTPTNISRYLWNTGTYLPNLHDITFCFSSRNTDRGVYCTVSVFVSSDTDDNCSLLSHALKM